DAVCCRYRSITHGEFSKSSHAISITVATTIRLGSDTRPRIGRSPQYNNTPCSICVNEYGSKKLCDVQCDHAALHTLNPYLQTAGRPSATNSALNTTNSTAPTPSVRRVQIFSPSSVVS